MSFQIYRNTSLGESLTETIEEMIEEGKINEDVAMAILKQFDLVSWTERASPLGRQMSALQGSQRQDSSTCIAQSPRAAALLPGSQCPKQSAKWSQARQR